MAINTLITIQDAIQAFVDGHEQLQRVIFEADDQRAPLITEEETFPVLFVAPVRVSVQGAMNVHTLRFYVYERMDEGRTDTMDNFNDTSLMLRDICVWWNDYGTDDILIVGDTTGEAVANRELDNLIGYSAEIDFEIPSHGRCSVPVSVTPSPTPSCEAASYLVEYENGTDIESGTIPSGGSKTIIVPNPSACDPATINLEGSPFLTVASGDTENITIVDQNGSSVTINGTSGSQIEIQQQTCYTLVDELTLDQNNPFGNTKRFTGLTGGYQQGGSYFDKDGVATTSALAFPDDIVINWFSRRNDKVIGIRRTPNGVDINLANAQTEVAGLTIGGYTGWVLPEPRWIFQLYGFETTLYNNSVPLGYDPFYSGTGNITTFWTDAELPAAATQQMRASNNHRFDYVAKTTVAPMRYLPFRVFTVNGTTLT